MSRIPKPSGQDIKLEKFLHIDHKGH